MRIHRKWRNTFERALVKRVALRQRKFPSTIMNEEGFCGIAATAITAN